MPRPATSVGVLLAALSITLSSAACAAKFYQPPTGAGQPLADVAAVWQGVTTSCRNANRFIAEIEISGWVGEARERVPRFTAHGAVTRDDDIYLDVPAPFGEPVLQMAGRAGQAVFLLPREDRVLRAASRDIVDRLIGLRWSPRDLLNVLAGCITTPSGEFKGTNYGTQASIELGGGARAYVRQRAGRWELVAGERDGLLIEYRAYVGAFPSLVRVSSTTSPNVTPLLLTFKIDQHQVNTTIEEAAFTLEVPANFLPMTLEELRSVKPLRDVKGGALSVSRKP